MIIIFHLPYGSLTSASLIFSSSTQLAASDENVSVDNVFDIRWGALFFFLLGGGDVYVPRGFQK